MTVSDLISALDLTAFVLSDGDRAVTGGYAGDLLSWVMGRAQTGDVWITIMSNPNVAAVAALTEVACVVLTEGVTPDADLTAKAGAQGLNLLGTGGGSFETAAALRRLLAG